MMNSLLPRLKSRVSGTNSSAAHPQSLEITGKVTGAYSKQQFIPGDGLDMRVLGMYIAHHYGDSIDWRPAVNTTDGREGFLFRASSPIGPQTIQLLQQETAKLREAEKEHNHSKYFDKLHAGWAQHKQYLAHEAQVLDISSVPTHRNDRNLPPPILDLPPKYDDIEGLHSHRRSIQPALETSRPPFLGLGRRPASCSDLEFVNPSGGFYPDGYSGSEADVREDANGLTFSRVYGPLGLPEVIPVQDSVQGFPSSAPQNAKSLSQGFSEAGSSRSHSTHLVPLSRARSTSSLHSSHYGFAYQPSPRLNVPNSELFFGTLETPLHGADQQVGPNRLRHNYADGRPAWA
ncbi:hypothetical protein L211DRAFT_836876 [Terfezia boudieri ATCC MYA-4762]|uniref:Uncharacterized protein n=1 Tax=Terfezia boudieri ATCC MYA-4762 TaxID=1051890 RepID=A0A3N4LTM0_9PEZI|nr:hypothetical protein L211DRAFT_836876 [Terfezia boudieri ATCC MYA-4762]